MSVLEIPLFPLHTVLFPGGILPLRIFEPRYQGMVSYCLKNHSGFGVVAIHEGRETEPVGSFHEVGTLAQIIDFDCLEDGMLGITCRGEQRLRVLSQRVQTDQLILGQVELLPTDPVLLPLPSHRPLVDFLRNILAREDSQAYSRLLFPDWDNAAWVGNRLSELLPLPVPIKQILLEWHDPVQRLDALRTLLREQQLC